MNKTTIHDGKSNLLHKSNKHWEFKLQPDLLHLGKRLETGTEKQRFKVTTTHM